LQLARRQTITVNPPDLMHVLERFFRNLGKVGFAGGKCKVTYRVDNSSRIHTTISPTVDDGGFLPIMAVDPPIRE
jgi:hypothetical protein